MTGVLLDTHLLVWAAGDDPRLPAAAREVILAGKSPLFFSLVSVWEVAIKWSARRGTALAEPGRFRARLIETDYRELGIAPAHVIATSQLPHRHRDPFDRLLLAQATVEGLTLPTADATLARCPGPVRLVT